MVTDGPGFPSGKDPGTLIVYGLVGDPKRVMKELAETRGNAPPLTSHYAIISADTGDIRLSSPGWLKLSLNQRLELQSSDDLFTFCAERLLQNTPPFSGPVRVFLKAYREFIKTEIGSKREELPLAAEQSDVFTHRDFLFSAWLPMPEARILLPRSFGGDEPAFAEASAAFCANGRIVAVQIEGTGTVLKSRQRKLDYLCETHPRIDLVRVSIERLRSGAFPAESFPDNFLRFWAGIDLPCGPCPPPIEIVTG